MRGGRYAGYQVSLFGDGAHFHANLDLYVTLGAAIAFGVLGLAGKVSREIISSGILAVLVLVGVSLLRGRSQGERIN